MNLDKEIIKAITQDVLWSVNEFYIIKESLEQAKIQVSYWEEEENWAQLIIDKKIIGYLWKKYPVIFILDEYYSTVSQHLKSENYLSVIKVRSLTDRYLSLGENVLNAIIDTQFDTDKFSAEDLWFNTNT